jgi:MFS family permease
MSRPESDTPEGIYNGAFWTAYLANLSLVCANTMSYRFADFVKHLQQSDTPGLAEQTTGWIVNLSLVGVLLSRLFIGAAMDRFGISRIWTIGSVGFSCGALLMMTVDHVGPAIVVARMLFVLGAAIMFVGSNAHIQLQVPHHRRTEAIGSLGSSGFVGMILGAQLEPRLRQFFPDHDEFFRALFGFALAVGLLNVVLVWVLTRHDAYQRPEVTPLAHTLLRRYWPGPVTIVAIMMGMGLAVSTVFLTRYAQTLRLESGFQLFFSSYAFAAFSVRIISRKWSRWLGRNRMILIGLSGLAMSYLLLIPVTRGWQFIPAGLATGFAHALLFPSVVSLGCGSFPEQYRGTGPTLILGFIELGTFLASPAFGLLIHYAGFHTMLLTATSITVLLMLVYWRRTRFVPDHDLLPALSER